MKKFLLIFYLAAITVFSQSFDATVNKNRLGLDDYFQVSFTYSGTDVNGLKNFRAPDLSNFIIASGPNQSTSMQFINGQMSGSRGFSYMLKPKATGQFTIGSASIESNGVVFTTKPIVVNIEKGSPQSTQAENDINKEIAQDLFILAIVDKNTALKGEQVTVTYKLYTRLNLRSPQVDKLPSYQGFWAEDLDLPQTITLERENYNGKVYNTGVLKRAALFPTQTGDLKVTPLSLKIPVMIQKKKKTTGNPFEDFFDDPFFNTQTETVEYLATSNTVSVKVLPVPGEESYKDFTGAIGNFDMIVSIDRNTVKRSEPLILKVRLTGYGNVKLLELPAFELPASIEMYDPVITDKINRINRVNGYKEFEYTLIPKSAGEFEIPAIKFLFYDIDKREFVEKKSEPIKIRVEKGPEFVSEDDDSGQFQKDIYGIKQSFDLVKGNPSLPYLDPVTISFTAIPIFAFIGFLFYMKRRERIYGDTNIMRKMFADKVAKARLKKAAVLLKNGVPDPFYIEITAAVTGYLEDKLLIPKSEFTHEVVSSTLNANTDDPELSQKTVKFIEKSEFIKYAPVDDIPGQMNQIYDEASSLISELEQKINFDLKAEVVK